MPVRTSSVRKNYKECLFFLQFDGLLHANKQETKHERKEECHKDGQQKESYPHVSPTTLKIRKKKEKGII